MEIFQALKANGFGFFYFPKRRGMDIKEWKRRLVDLLKEHQDVGENFTGRAEININEGGITKIYIFKELK